MEEKEQRRLGTDQGKQNYHHRPSPCIGHLFSPTRQLGAPIEFQEEDRDHEDQNSATPSGKRRAWEPTTSDARTNPAQFIAWALFSNKKIKKWISQQEVTFPKVIRL